MMLAKMTNKTHRVWQRCTTMAAIAGVSLCLFSSSAFAAADCQRQLLDKLTGQELNYKVHWSALTMSAKRKIEAVENKPNTWHMSNIASVMFLNLNEHSRFSYADGHIESDGYHYNRKGMGGGHDLDITFTPGQYVAKNWEKTNTRKVPGAVFDPLNYQLQLQLDLACAPDRAHFSYDIADLKKTKHYAFVRVGEEQVKVAAGTWNAVVLEKRDNGDKLDRIWLVPDLDYTIVKLLHRDDGKEAVLELQQAP